MATRSSVAIKTESITPSQEKGMPSDESDAAAAVILTKISTDPTGYYEKARQRLTQASSETSGPDDTLMRDKAANKTLRRSHISVNQAPKTVYPTPRVNHPPFQRQRRTLPGSSSIALPKKNQKPVSNHQLHGSSLPTSSRMIQKPPPQHSSPIYISLRQSRLASSSRQESFNSDQDQNGGITPSGDGKTEENDDDEYEEEEVFRIAKRGRFQRAIVEDDNEDDDMVAPVPSQSMRYVNKGKGKGNSEDKMLERADALQFSQDSLSESSSHRYQDGVTSNQRSSRGQSEINFGNPGKGLLPSRYSGAPMPWGLNKDPTLIDQKDVSNASLLKRGLSRGNTAKVCKRGYGANDPENIRIVNLRENRQLSFPEIVEKLNSERIDAGRNPSLSVCGVTSRYNRTAPLLFASQGKQFIPLSQRRAMRNGSARVHGAPTGFIGWTDPLDEELVRAVQAVDARRWQMVADQFFEQTGLRFSPSDVSRRHAIL